MATIIAAKAPRMLWPQFSIPASFAYADYFVGAYTHILNCPVEHINNPRV